MLVIHRVKCYWQSLLQSVLIYCQRKWNKQLLYRKQMYQVPILKHAIEGQNWAVLDVKWLIKIYSVWAGHVANKEINNRKPFKIIWRFNCRILPTEASSCERFVDVYFIGYCFCCCFCGLLLFAVTVTSIILFI